MESKPCVLAVAQDADSLEAIDAVLSAQGCEVRVCRNPEQGRELLQHLHPDVILADAALVGEGQWLARVLDFDPGAQVLLLTDHYSSESAVEGIHLGARDCLRKPLVAEALRQKVQELLDEARLRKETQELDEKLLENYRFHGMVGRSPQMLEVFARIRRVAPHYRVALISGPTGTGKELVAQALHLLSPVSNRRFAVCNCSAIVETLFESELFGHVKGAFTGATQDRVGLFEYAQGGTVFLDEISDMPLSTQSKLLRVVQNQELQRVGSSEVRKVEVRVVAATNREMRGLVAGNLFREDLYYRLSMVELKLPRLAERKEDLPLLQRHFVERFSNSFGKPVRGITRRAQALLSRHGWAGNVRELENVLGHGCMMTETEFIDVRDLPDYMRPDMREAGQEPELASLADVGRRYTQHVLSRLGGNKLQAAQVLGISRATLYRILREGPPAAARGGLDFLGQPGGAAKLRIQ